MRSLKRALHRSERLLLRHHYVLLGILLLLCALVAFSRKPDALFHAQFWAEDGRTWYTDAYTQGPFTSLFLTYGGYVVMVYRFIASLSLLLPLHHAPLFFNLAALGFQLLPIVLLLSSRLKHVIPYKTLAVILCLLYICVPNSSEVFINLTNIQWHLGVAAFLVLIASRSTRRIWQAFDMLVLIATGLAGPLVIVLWPIAFYLWWRQRSTQHTRNLITLSALSFIQLLSIFVISGYHRVGAQPNADVFYLVKMLVGQIFVGGLLGQKYVATFYDSKLFLLLILAGALALIIYAIIYGPRWLKLLNGYAVLLIATMLASLKPVKEFDVWQGLTNPGGGQRYWYIPILAWITTLIWILLAARLKTLRVLCAVLLLSLVTIGIPRDWGIKPYQDLDFTSHAINFEKAPIGSRVTIPINPAGWTMTLKKR